MNLKLCETICKRKKMAMISCGALSDWDQQVIRTYGDFASLIAPSLLLVLLLAESGTTSDDEILVGAQAIIVLRPLLHGTFDERTIHAGKELRQVRKE